MKYSKKPSWKSRIKDFFNSIKKASKTTCNKVKSKLTKAELDAFDKELDDIMEEQHTKPEIIHPPKPNSIYKAIIKPHLISTGIATVLLVLVLSLTWPKAILPVILVEIIGTTVWIIYDIWKSKRR